MPENENMSTGNMLLNHVHVFTMRQDGKQIPRGKRLEIKEGGLTLKRIGLVQILYYFWGKSSSSSSSFTDVFIITNVLVYMKRF